MYYNISPIINILLNHQYLKILRCETSVVCVLNYLVLLFSLSEEVSKKEKITVGTSILNLHANKICHQKIQSAEKPFKLMIILKNYFFYFII